MIIPAIDLMNGRIVRLYQGSYEKKKIYSTDLFYQINKYQEQGAQRLHLVDLDGAKIPDNKQTQLLKNIISNINISVQVGGGIRTERDINTLILAGAQKVVISSAAILNKKEVKKWLKCYGGDILVLALDVIISNDNRKEIVINGWKENSKFTLEETIEYFSEFGLKNVLCTDISKDGTLLGPNLDLYQIISRQFKHILFQSSGGIGSLKDIMNLKETGVKHVIIGRSFLEKKFTMLEAIQCWQKE